jgi:hypothetical protein
MRRRMVLVPMSMEATLLGKVGSDFTAEFLWDNVSGQFGLEDFERCAVVEIIGLERGSRDNPHEELVGGFTHNRVDGEIETVECFVVVIF